MKLVACNIKQIINDKGFMQKRVAEKAGYSQKKFSDMLNGRKRICDNDVLNIANALEVTPNELFGIGLEQKQRKETRIWK